MKNQNNEIEKEIEELKSEIKTLRPIVKRKYNEFKRGIEEGKASNQKNVLKILDELEFKLLNELRFNAKPFVFQGKTGYTFTISTDELQEFRKKLEHVANAEGDLINVNYHLTS